MTDYIYNKIYNDIQRGIYNVNGIYARKKQLPFNPELYDSNSSQKLLEMVISKNYENFLVLLERKPDPNTTDVLGKSLLDYLMENSKYKEAIRLIKMGANPSQKIMMRCLTNGLIIESKSYRMEMIVTLINSGLEPLSTEQLLHSLHIYNKIISELHDEIKYKALLSFEKRLKFMYNKYLNG